MSYFCNVFKHFGLLVIFLVSQLPHHSLAQQSKNMVLASRYDDDSLPVNSGVAYNDVWGYAYPDGREIAVLGTLDSILFFEVTDPANIHRVFSFSGGKQTIWREFKTYQNYLYAITDAEHEGLTVFHLGTSPDSISFHQRDYSVFLTSHMLFVDTATAHLYLAGAYDSTASVDLIMMDLQPDPGHPQLIQKIDLPGNYMHDLFVRNDTAYCSHGYNGFYIYKIFPNGNFSELYSINAYPQQGYNHSSWLHKGGKYLIWADETHNTSLKMVDVSDRTNPKIKQLFRSAKESPADTASMAHNPYFQGDYAYVSYYHDGVVVFNCEDPLHPYIVAYYDTEPGNTNYNVNYEGAWGVYPFLPSGNILVSDILNGLFVLYLDFQLDLCTANLGGSAESQTVYLHWELPDGFCMDRLVLQKAVGTGPFSDILSIQPHDTMRHYRDALQKGSDQFYRLRTLHNGQETFSEIVHFTNREQTGIDYLTNERLFVSSGKLTYVSSLKIFRPDGSMLYSGNKISLPFRLPMDQIGLAYAQWERPDGSMETIKIFIP